MKDRIYIEPELIKGVAGGNKKAFAELVNRLKRPAYYHALALLGDHDDAVDISQEAFIRAWKSRSILDPERQFYPWFYTILKRLCLNRHRDRNCKKELPMHDFEAWLEQKPADDSPGRELILQEQQQMILKALSRLSPDDREIIVLKDLEGYTYKEIAELLQIPVGTVMSRLYTARKRCKTQMEEAGYEHS